MTRAWFYYAGGLMGSVLVWAWGSVDLGERWPLVLGVILIKGSLLLGKRFDD